MNLSDIKLEDLNEIYREFAELIGIENAYIIYNEFKGSTVILTKRFYSQEYIENEIMKKHMEGTSIRELAREFDYTERWIREKIKKGMYGNGEKRKKL